VDAALGGDLATALAELDRLIAAGEEPAMLLAQVLGQIELAAVASTAGGRDATDISRRLGGVNPGRMSAVLSATRGERGRLALDAVARASAIDRALKTGRIRQPRDALQDLIATLAESGQRMQSGRSW
jgi:DNA polymerase III delta subunit